MADLRHIARDNPPRAVSLVAELRDVAERRLGELPHGFLRAARHPPAIVEGYGLLYSASPDRCSFTASSGQGRIMIVA